MGVYVKKEVISLRSSDGHARVPIYTSVGDFSVFSTIEKKAMLNKWTRERDYLNSSKYIVDVCKGLKGPFKKLRIKKILALTRERLELLETRIMILRLEIERDKFKKAVHDTLNHDPTKLEHVSSKEP